MAEFKGFIMTNIEWFWREVPSQSRCAHSAAAWRDSRLDNAQCRGWHCVSSLCSKQRVATHQAILHLTPTWIEIKHIIQKVVELKSYRFGTFRMHYCTTTRDKTHSDCGSCESKRLPKFVSCSVLPSPSKLSHMSKDYFLFHIDADNIQIYKYRNSFHIGKLSLLWLSCGGRKQQVPPGDVERQKFWCIISTLYIVIAFSAGRM